MPRRSITLRGVRQNNLKGIDLDLPLGRFIAVTGVSGSGKSSLALDTIYAEGQRRYVETFSTYARQFLARMDKPDADRIDGIPPCIAIEQSNPVRTSRSSVGTMTEINDYLKLLFAKVGTIHCRACGEPVEVETPEVVAGVLKTWPDGEAAIVTYSIPAPDGWAALRTRLAMSGFTRVVAAGKAVKVDDIELDLPRGARVDVVVDRLRAGAKLPRSRAVEAIEAAYRHGSGRAAVHRGDGAVVPFSEHLHCAACDVESRAPAPHDFSFNSPLGACPHCKGFGRVIDLDLELVVPLPQLSLSQRAIRPWSTAKTKDERRQLFAHCRKHRIPTDVPWRELTDEQRRLIVERTRGFHGIRGWFDWLESRTYRMHVRVLLSRYRSYVTCPACDGTRLRPEAALTRIAGRSIADVWRMSLGDAAAFFRAVELTPAQQEIGGLLLDEVRGRLGYLVDVGLEYLTLDRASRTLSGGEAQRVALTTALGSALVHTLYVLDEPSIGLHPRDTERLVRIIEGLRDRGNTVLVVEHDATVIERADEVIDVGPGAGEHGGEIVFQGSVDELRRCPDSITGAFLDGRERVPIPARRRSVDLDDALVIEGADENNLCELDVTIPLGCLVALTGVSGSGKSSLVEGVLWPALKRALGESVGKVGAHRTLRGAERVRDAVLVDQSPIGRTPRSNPATYTGLWTRVRSLFAGTEAAYEAGFSACTFSFNVDGGRCPGCRGDGYERVEMQFLADVFVSCPDCSGARFRPEVLAIEWRGKTIREVLDLTVNEAYGFFEGEGDIRRRLRPLIDTGLGYLRLGQPATTLSGGEAQRLKLSTELAKSGAGRTLYLFDEPTTGLHPADVRHLVACLQRLCDRGHGILVVEHDVDVIAAADWVIDLGPEGGEGGGRIVVAGTPDDVAACDASHTGRFLARHTLVEAEA